MVDVVKTLDIDYLAVTCGSTFRGLHEAVVNYGNNTKPEVITCNHCTAPGSLDTSLS